MLAGLAVHPRRLDPARPPPRLLRRRAARGGRAAHSTRFVDALRRAGVSRSATGVFRADMEVELVNDGPVTHVWEDRPGPTAHPPRLGPEAWGLSSPPAHPGLEAMEAGRLRPSRLATGIELPLSERDA